MLTIQTWGGWGDVLREISLLPCGRKKTGFWSKSAPPFMVRHLPLDQADVRTDAGVPSPEAVRDLLSRCPSLRWGGVGPVSRLQRMSNRAFRAAMEPFHPGLFDPQFQWRLEDKISPASGKIIVVQTHLEGLPAKRWTLENWLAVLQGLKLRHPNALIHILDPAGAPFSGEGIRVESGLTFPQAIRLVEQCDFLISVDSWSKYVAGWKGIPQLIVVPDQRPDYPHLTAETVWRHSFRGLHRSRGVHLLGLRPHPVNHTAKYTFGTMDHLLPMDVLRAVEAVDFRVSAKRLFNDLSRTESA